jgi:hypothetical protein
MGILKKLSITLCCLAAAMLFAGALRAQPVVAAPYKLSITDLATGRQADITFNGSAPVEIREMDDPPFFRIAQPEDRKTMRLWLGTAIIVTPMRGKPGHFKVEYKKRSLEGVASSGRGTPAPYPEIRQESSKAEMTVGEIKTLSVKAFLGKKKPVFTCSLAR